MDRSRSGWLNTIAISCRFAGLQCKPPIFLSLSLSCSTKSGCRIGVCSNAALKDPSRVTRSDFLQVRLSRLMVSTHHNSQWAAACPLLRQDLLSAISAMSSSNCPRCLQVISAMSAMPCPNYANITISIKTSLPPSHTGALNSAIISAMSAMPCPNYANIAISIKACLPPSHIGALNSATH